MTERNVRESKEAIIARMWLHYYNRVLFERGLITERERNRMALKIQSRTGPVRPAE